MSVTNDISGTVFDNLETYAQITSTGEDDAILEKLNQLIFEAVPDADPGEVGEKIDEILKQNPTWTIDQVLEAVVTSLNPGCGDDIISEIKTAWEAFTGVSDLSSDDVADIIENPASFAVNDSDNASVSLKQAIKILMLLLVEIAGDESAAMLEQGVLERDNIEALGEKKATEIITKGWIEGSVQALSGLCSILGSIGTGVGAAGGFKNVGNTVKSQAWGNMGQSLSGFCSALSSLCSSTGSVITGYIDADIAIIDSEGQQAQIRKDTADQLKNSAATLIDTALSLLKTMGQADYQTMTAIGRA